MNEISVVIPIYNRANYIIETLRSVEAQQLLPHEVIVVDDASTDDSVAVVREYSKGTRLDIKIIPNDHRKGNSGALNTGIKCAKGDLIAIQDSDDLWTPWHLKQLADALEKYPQASVAFSGIDIFGDAKDVEQKKNDFKVSVEKCLNTAFEKKENGILLSNEKLCYAIFNGGFPFRCQASVMRKEFLIKNDLYFDEDITYTLDSQFATIASYHTKFLYVENTGTKIRRHEENDGDAGYGDKIENSYDARVLKLKKYFRNKRLTSEERKAFAGLLWSLQEEALMRRVKKGNAVKTVVECGKLLKRVPSFRSLKSVVKVFIQEIFKNRSGKCQKPA